MWGQIAMAAASALGGKLGSDSAKDAAKDQLKAARENIEFQKWLFQQQTALQEPFREGGLSAQDRLLTMLGIQSPTSSNTSDPLYGKYAGDFGMDDFEADPGYAFRLAEGLKALERGASARGLSLSGKGLKDTVRFGQDLGSQEYTNAFNRYQVNRSNQLNPLFSLLGGGQSATNQVQQAGSQLGQSMAQGYADIGNARASGQVGSTNALMGALNGIGQAAGYYWGGRNGSNTPSWGWGEGIPGTTPDY